MERKCDPASSAKDMHEKLNGRIITQNVTIVTTNKYKIEVLGKVIDQVICSQNGINRSLWMKAGGCDRVRRGEPRELKLPQSCLT